MPCARTSPNSVSLQRTASTDCRLLAIVKRGDDVAIAGADAAGRCGRSSLNWRRCSSRSVTSTRIHAQHRASEASRRLETIPGIGVIGATAIAATVTDPARSSPGRELAAWIGLVPRQNSTGGKQKLGGISKQGDRYLRRLLVVGATAVIRHARRHPDKHPWIMKLLARKPAKVVAVALANKMARIAWAILAKGGTYRAPALAAAA